MSLADAPLATLPLGARVRTLRVAVVNGSTSEKSKTRGLVEVFLQSLSDALAPEGVGIEETVVDVYRLGPSFATAVERHGIAPEIDAILRQVEESDLLIAATPVFRGTYTGLFKHFFDLIEQYALANKPVFLAATGGGDHHALVLEHALRPLFGFFQSMVFPVAVFASAGDFDGVTLLNPRVYGRIELAIADVKPLLVAAAGERRTPPSSEDPAPADPRASRPDGPPWANALAPDVSGRS